jgi:hypothetical protein
VVGRSPPNERAKTGSGAALGPGGEQDTSLPPSQPYQVPAYFNFFIFLLMLVSAELQYTPYLSFWLCQEKCDLRTGVAKKWQNFVFFFHYVSGTLYNFIFYICIDACQCRATIHTVSVFLAVSREM